MENIARSPIAPGGCSFVLFNISQKAYGYIFGCYFVPIYIRKYMLAYVQHATHMTMTFYIVACPEMFALSPPPPSHIYIYAHFMEVSMRKESNWTLFSLSLRCRRAAARIILFKNACWIASAVVVDPCAGLHEILSLIKINCIFNQIYYHFISWCASLVHGESIFLYCVVRTKLF